MIHIYTGDGKGKTTAAMGLALRAAGHGQRVVIVQFLKGSDTGETEPLSRLPGVTLLRCTRDYGFFPFQDEAAQAAVIREHDANLREARRLINGGGLLILDEAATAYSLGALDKSMMDELLLCPPEGLEVVLTGRNAPPHFIEAADYVSDIRCVKHPYEKGVQARKGVEY